MVCCVVQSVPAVHQLPPHPVPASPSPQPQPHILLAAVAGVKTFTDLDITPHKVTDGLAVELIRYQRTGGYEGGDTSQLAKALPTKVKKYFGEHAALVDEQLGMQSIAPCS